ncbi:P-loop NTPase [Nocardioides aestuarii]|uniref:CpaE family protein n=1 Tax=Nocardioides aestuarii TaxID=252231 RepID=A0ABW4TJG2_9ACTN
MSPVVVTLVLAAGAAWESAALTRLGERPDVVVLKRCVDAPDLLASAAAGQADVAVVALDAPGLDHTAVDHLRGHGVRPVAVLPGGPELDAAALRATRIGVRALVGDHELAALPDLVAAGDEPDDTVVRDDRALEQEPLPGPGEAGPVVVVWGPAGAPGRTTLATGLAAEIGRHHRTVLVDADPWGGAVAQQLGIVDEASGLLTAARLVASGQLPERFGSVQRSLDHRLTVVTGLPRADRWVEVRAGVVDHLLDVARGHGVTVVDTGASLERDAALDAGRTGRNTMTIEALEAADEVVVVGGADPVGLARLARGLVELRETVGRVAPWVVVNRMRPTLGWSEQSIAAMLGGLAVPERLHFLPDDRATVDRALVAGRSLAEVGDSAVGRGVAAVAQALVPAAQAAKSR